MTKKVISNISFLPFLFYLTLEASFPSFISDADWIIYGNKNSLLNWNKTLHSVAILKNEINSVITQTQSFTKSVLTSRANKNIISIGNCPPQQMREKKQTFLMVRVLRDFRIRQCLHPLQNTVSQFTSNRDKGFTQRHVLYQVKQYLK